MKLFGTEHRTSEDAASETSQQKEKHSSTLQGIPAVYPDAVLSDGEESDRHTFFLEALNAGFAFSDCLFNRNEVKDFRQELDEPFGTFFNTLGGNWANLRGLNDIDLWIGAIDNLLESLTAEKLDITNWYAIGFHLSTLLNIAGRDSFSDIAHHDAVQARWDNTLDAFRFAASEANIPEEHVDNIQSMLENLIGSEADRDYSNMAKLRKLVRELTAIAK